MPRRPRNRWYLRGVTEALVEQQDTDKVMQRVSELLDESVVVNNAEGFKAKEFEAQYEIIKRGRTWDLSKIDFKMLRHDFGQAVYKNIEIADRRGFIARKLALMLAQNSTRGQFAERFLMIAHFFKPSAITCFTWCLIMPRRDAGGPRGKSAWN